MIKNSLLLLLRSAIIRSLTTKIYKYNAFKHKQNEKVYRKIEKLWAKILNQILNITLIYLKTKKWIPFSP